ncbi:MAG: AI-2E family transporter [Chloroflexi bacterium]|nr:AI-2E family transporter [Chloroflexota bacterium]
MSEEASLGPPNPVAVPTRQARRLRLALVGGSLVLLCLLLWSARDALTPFIFGGIIAYLLLPAVRRLEAALATARVLPAWRRPIAVLTVYVATIVTIVLVVRLVVPPLVAQILSLVDSFPMLANAGRDRISQLLAIYHDLVADELEAAIEAGLADVSSTLAAAARALATATLG